LGLFTKGAYVNVADHLIPTGSWIQTLETVIEKAKVLMLSLVYRRED